MVRCLGHRIGTDCSKTSSSPTGVNWSLWQLCYRCAQMLHPEYYLGKIRHGTGGKYLGDPICVSMVTADVS